ncbi:MAG: M81 family metallopeptidase [Gemmataceae bacterium]|nr:M81 family metallopeptidase [Gemmataceae bacterium]
MRIAIGQLWQETNTFNPLPTTRRDFEAFGVLRGAELVAQMADVNELGGFIQSLRRWPEQPEIVGLVRLPAWPGGAATHETFEWLRDELVGALRAQPPVDAVLLALHGALTAVGAPDVEGPILEAVRQIVGPAVPIVATLDLHCNITRQMVQNANVLVPFHTVPHIDVVETGERGAAVLHRILCEGARPVRAFQKVPMVVPAEWANTQDPASISSTFRKQIEQLETHPKVLSAGLATVQPWLDIPELGSAVVIATDNDPELAKRECARLAAQLWEQRRDYMGDLMPVEAAVHEAFRDQAGGLVVLGDGADSTNSGSTGDSTCILRELVKYEWPRPALVSLVSPEVVAEATRLGIGAQRTGPLGGVRAPRFSQPIVLTTEVVRFFDARFVLSGHLGKNLRCDLGPSVVLRHGNVHMVVTSRPGPHFAPKMFEEAGLRPFEASVLVAKSPCGFRAAYQEKAKRIIVVQSTGCAPADFWRYDYREIPRPLWPWDEIETWAPGPTLA